MTREGLYEICVAPFVFMENEVKDLYGVYDQKKKNDELYHYGVLGMNCGVRKDKKN